MIPIDYYPGEFTATGGELMLKELQTRLDWKRYGDGTVPRMEYYINTVGVPYTYGRGDFARTYQPQPEIGTIDFIRHRVERMAGAKFEVCFLNRYLNQSDHLGWHADDSPEMDDARPIAIVSFGVEREIWFRRKLPRVVNGNDLEELPPTITKVLLQHGSVCIMRAGMQDTHEHRIPKCGRQCGERISLTFRGYVR